MARFDKQGTHVLTLSSGNFNEFDPGAVNIWSFPNGKEPIVINGHSKRIISASFSPDGNTVLTASLDGTAKLWRTDNGKLIDPLKGHRDALTGASFSDDGVRIVTSSQDTTAKIWNSGNGQLIATLEYGKPVQDAAFSFDGKYVATVGDFGFPVIWDAETGAPLVIFRDKVESWSGVSFTPDGKKMVATTFSGGVYIWTLPQTDVSPKALAQFVIERIDSKADTSQNAK